MVKVKGATAGERRGRCPHADLGWSFRRLGATTVGIRRLVPRTWLGPRVGGMHRWIPTLHAPNLGRTPNLGRVG
jgi:hypothetical protein